MQRFTMRIPAALFGLMLLSTGCSFLRAGEAFSITEKHTPEEWVSQFYEKNNGNKYYAATALSKMGKDAYPVLTEALKDKREHVREFAARAFSEMRKVEEPAIGPLMECLQSERVLEVQLFAAKALGNSNSDRAANALIGGMRSKDEELRYQCAHEIRRVQPERRKALHALLKALQDPSEKVRKAAMFSLRSIYPTEQDAGLAREIEPLMIDARADVRVVAFGLYENLKLSDEQAVPLLSKALNDHDAAVKSKALSALIDRSVKNPSTLENIQLTLVPPPLGEGKGLQVAVLTGIIRRDKDLKENEHLVAAAKALGELKEAAAPAARLLAELGPGRLESDAVLQTLLKIGSGAKDALPLLPKWIESAKDRNQAIKAAGLIAYLGTQEPIIPEFLRFASDETSMVRMEVFKYLSQRREMLNDDALAAMTSILERPDPPSDDIQNLYLPVSKAIPLYRRWLKNPSAAVRRHVVYQLSGYFREARAAEMDLVGVLTHDTDARVREAAANALDNVGRGEHVRNALQAAIDKDSSPEVKAAAKKSLEHLKRVE